MKKSIFTKAIVALMVIALMLPCFPVIASAETLEAATYTPDSSWYGDGSATEFTISTPEQLAYFMQLGQEGTEYFASKTVKLGADIVWNEGVATATGFVPSEKQGNKIYNWVPYAQPTVSGGGNEFKGIFDGQGHTIHGLYIATNVKNVGFIGQTRGGTVKNVAFENAYVETTEGGSGVTYVGIVVGAYMGNVVVENVHTDGYVNAINSIGFTGLVGGLVGGSGFNSATLVITNCTSSGAINTNTREVGGLVGATRSTAKTGGAITMTDCVNYASVKGVASVSGLLGNLSGPGTFTRCYSLGKVCSTSYDSMGGIWSSYFATLRMAQAGTAVNDPTSETWCRPVSFTDCYYAEHADSSSQAPLFIYKNDCGYNVTVTYGTESKQAYYYPTHANCNTVDEETGAERRMEATELARHAKALFTNGALAIPAKGTDAVKVAGVQIKKNDTTFAARFLATVNTAEIENLSAVKSIGFQVSILGDYAKNGATAVKQQDCGAVYTSILSDYGMKTVTAAEMSADYVGTLVIDKIPATGIQHVLVRAYYTTEGDAVSYSEAAVFTFVNGAFAGSSFLSTANSDSTQGSVTSLGVSRNTTTYDLASLLPDSVEALVVYKEDEVISNTQVDLEIGANEFRADYTIQGINYRQAIKIVRRDTYRVTFNSNGGSYIPAKQVAEGEKIPLSSAISPTREGYKFLGWYDEDGKKVAISSKTYTDDTVLYARWESTVTSYSKSDVDPFVFETSSAALNLNWHDYGNALGERPTEVFCTLQSTSSNASYLVRLTEDGAAFVGDAPAGAVIGQGAGKWTVKITGLTSEYTFTQNDLGKAPYDTLQSGTTVTNTYSKQYRPLLDDTAALYTANGRFYDLAGNVVVLKGVVTVNVGTVNFVGNTGTASIARLRDEGVNCIRITMQLHDTTTSNIGYLTTADGGAQTAERQKELKKLLTDAVDTITGLGLYCIVDWGVIGTNPADYQSEAITFFSAFAEEYLNNPYVLYEICNEPNVTSGTWHTTVKPYCEAVIAAIRATGSRAVVIAAPNNYAKAISEYTTNNKATDDPIDHPFATELSYNVAYTFHVYAYNHEYNREDGKDSSAYGWRLKEAVEAGLTLVLTEFSPATSSIEAQSQGVTLASIPEAEKYLNVFLEYDVSYFLFRYISHFSTMETSSQHMFIRGYNTYLNAGTWTEEHLTEWGKWFLEATVGRTGFIKAADFTPKTPA